MRTFLMYSIAAVGLIALAIGSTLLSGFVLSTLWGWFLVPLGLPIISIPIAIGITVIMKLMTSEYPQHEEKYYYTAIVHPFIALLIGWVATLFM